MQKKYLTKFTLVQLKIFIPLHLHLEIMRQYLETNGIQLNQHRRLISITFNDLNIIDITDKTNFETLPAYDFYHGGYSRKENENDSSNGLDYWRYYTFFVTDEDRKVIGMNIRQNGLLDGQMIDPINDDEDDIKRELDLKLAGLVLTRGTVAAFNDTYQRIEITDSHDWAEDFGRWNANRGNSAVEWRDAVIVKNSKRIEKEDINLGDYLYVLRDDEDALIIFVEEN